jgi:serine/threonine protein kinase
MGDPQPDLRLETFTGSDRFEVQRRLGAGGFGVVYAALDRRTGSVVALKILRRGDAPSLYRFKREFRALADVTHPNLVGLYELFCEDGRWFFTMELVEGVDFLEHVWGVARAGGEPSSGSSATRSAAALDQTLLGTSVGTPPPPAGGAVQRTTVALSPGAGGPPSEPPEPAGSFAVAPQMERLRDALAQLASGLLALHDSGKRHCDIKPLNVRVTPEGRLVLLDFGLVHEGPGQADLYDSGIAGSVHYMSPEQASGQPLAAATDWYSVGVMLFEALTGTVPFKGSITEVLRAKQQVEPPAPSRLADNVPADLDEICRGLLRRDPARRMTGRELLARIGRQERRSPSGHRTPAEAAFVGRDPHLARLEAAFAASRAGRPAVVQVRGRSGMGKTTLVARFLERVEDLAPGAIALSGRCFERESVPYKGLDTAVEALAQRLRALPMDARPALPEGGASLLRLFPVLTQVPWPVAPALETDGLDAHEARRRAVAALRGLLGSLARQAPVVLAIDDLQWSDVESASVIAELLGGGDPPPLLLVAAFREEAAPGPLVAALTSLAERVRPEVTFDRIEVGTLEPEEARTLARSLLHGAAPELADTIARESGGSALFLTELVRYWRGGGTLGPITLEGMIRGRLEPLSGAARRLLEVVAVAAQPVPVGVAREAAAAGAGEPEVASLRGTHLARFHGAGPPTLEMCHDRIREVVVADLDPATLREIHRRLARALEAGGRGDPEALAVHLFAAGETEAAARYAVTAAARAARALAFDRAARLYRLALDARGPGHPESPRLQRERGDALAHAGRGAEAAEAYLAAVPHAPADEVLELRRHAAEQYLRAGHIDEGLEIMHTVLRTVGLAVARSPRHALFSLLWRRAWLRVRGLGFRERAESAVSPSALLRIDVCWSMANGLSLVDNVRGADFQARHLLLALDAGEPYRVARALAVEAAHTGTGGTRTQVRTRWLVREASRLSERVAHPHALGMAASMAGLAAFLEGQWKTAARETDRAARILRAHCPGAAHELATAHSYHLMSLLYLGELAELARRLPPLLQDAQERGDLFTALRLRTRLLAAAHLAADEPERASREVEQAIARWSHGGFYVQHYTVFWARATLALYAGRPTQAWRGLDAEWNALRRSLLLRVQFCRIESWHLRGRSVLAAVAADEAPAEALRRVEQDVARIRGERTTWGDALALLLEAGLAATRGQRGPALALVERAEAACRATDLGLFAAAARRRRGELAGGPEGRALTDEADAWMRGRAVAHPARMSRLQVPGRWS